MLELLSLDIRKPEDRLIAGFEFSLLEKEYIDILDEARAVGCSLLKIADENRLSELKSKMLEVKEFFSRDETEQLKSTLNKVKICVESIDNALAEAK